MTENEVLEPPFPGPCQAGPEPVARGRFRDLSHVSECMRHRRAISPEMPAKNAPVAQLDRALDYESRGQEFESLRARHLTHCQISIFLFLLFPFGGLVCSWFAKSVRGEFSKLLIAASDRPR